MRGYRTTAALAMVVVAACSAGGIPATTPPPVPSTTTTAIPPTNSTTTTVATTTTMDRMAEIEAIFQDLEERRLQALYDGDRDAFQALFANDEYRERSMGAFDVVEFTGRPSGLSIAVVGITTDSDDCIAAAVRFGKVEAVLDSAEQIRDVVLETTTTGWGFSYAGEEWQCEGPHPLSR